MTCLDSLEEVENLAAEMVVAVKGRKERVDGIVVMAHEALLGDVRAAKRTDGGRALLKLMEARGRSP